MRDWTLVRVGLVFLDSTEEHLPRSSSDDSDDKLCVMSMDVTSLVCDRMLVIEPPQESQSSVGFITLLAFSIMPGEISVTGGFGSGSCTADVTSGQSGFFGMGGKALPPVLVGESLDGSKTCSE